MFSSFASFIELIKSIPTIVSAIIAMKQLWEQYLDVNERRETMKKFTEGLNHARETKDPEQVNKVLRDITSNTPK